MALVPTTSRKCARCRAESQSGAGYVSIYGEFYCPACYPKVRVEKARWSGLPWIALLALALVMTRTSPPGNRLGWIYTNLFTVVFLSGLVILPHELGHALSGYALGMKVFRVMVGLGPVVWKRPFLGGTLEIHRYWLGGGTVLLDRKLPGFRLRHWVTVACGPLVSVLLLLAVLPFVHRPHSLAGFGRAWDLPADFALANWLVLFVNLLPRRTKSIVGLGMTDGLALLRTPFLKDAKIREIAALYYAVPASEALRDQKYEDALRLHEEGLREFPESILLRHDRAVVLINLARFDQAREQFLELSKVDAIDPQLRLFCQSNIAVADVLLERPDLLEEADRLSTEAMTSLAWHPGIRATRGSVLVAQGKVDEGMALVREGLARMEDDRSRAAAACTLAVGLHQKGDLEEGRKYLEMAERLGPRSPRLPRVRALYGSGIAQ